MPLPGRRSRHWRPTLRRRARKGGRFHHSCPRSRHSHGMPGGAGDGQDAVVGRVDVSDAGGAVAVVAAQRKGAAVPNAQRGACGIHHGAVGRARLQPEQAVVQNDDRAPVGEGDGLDGGQAGLQRARCRGRADLDRAVVDELVEQEPLDRARAGGRKHARRAQLDVVRIQPGGPAARRGELIRAGGERSDGAVRARDARMAVVDNERVARCEQRAVRVAGGIEEVSPCCAIPSMLVGIAEPWPYP